RLRLLDGGLGGAVGRHLDFGLALAAGDDEERERAAGDEQRVGELRAHGSDGVGRAGGGFTAGARKYDAPRYPPTTRTSASTARAVARSGSSSLFGAPSGLTKEPSGRWRPARSVATSSCQPASPMRS